MDFQWTHDIGHTAIGIQHHITPYGQFPGNIHILANIKGSDDIDIPICQYPHSFNIIGHDDQVDRIPGANLVACRICTFISDDRPVYQ